jgi:hypothetical protein
MIRIALILALCSSLAAMVFVALWWREREARTALRDELAAADRVVEVLNDVANERLEVQLQWQERYDALAQIPDSTTCGPSVGRALDLLRDGRARP